MPLATGGGETVLQLLVGATTADSSANPAGVAGHASTMLLPALEMLAYFLDVPVSYFWGDRALSEQTTEPRPARR